MSNILQLISWNAFYQMEIIVVIFNIDLSSSRSNSKQISIGFQLNLALKSIT